MGQIDVAVKYAKKIETILENKYNAEGKGLHEKLDGLNGILDENIIKKTRYIATIRNKVVHEDEYDIEDIEDFIETAKEVLSLLDNDPVKINEKSFHLRNEVNLCENTDKQNPNKTPLKKFGKGIIDFIRFIFKGFIKTVAFIFIAYIGYTFTIVFLGEKTQPGYSIFPLIITIVVLYFLFNRFKTTSFDGYLQKNPDMFKNGRVKCINCGSDSIYVQKYGYFLFTTFNNHICRTCGTTLYRSRTN